MRKYPFHSLQIILRYSFLFALFSLSGNIDAASGTGALSKSDGKYDIIPLPQALAASPGFFHLTADTPLLVNSEAAREVATYFQALIIPATGYKLDIIERSVPEDQAIHLFIAEGAFSSEAYELRIDPERVSILASDRMGLFYGVQTLRQMLPEEIESAYPVNNVQWKMAGVRIKDSPRFHYRGMHLDVSRHFFSKDFIKRYIDLIALHKMNVFHWHLTDDQGWRIEIKKYPRLTSVGSRRERTVIAHPYDRTPRYYDDKPVSGFYTQEDVREIVQYALQRQVVIIPEIDVPGHTSAVLAAYPELACIKKDFKVKTEFHIFRDVICPTGKSFAFLKDVFTEVAGLFPGPYIHIGGDEVMKDQWKACDSCTELMRREGLENYDELQSYFVRRVEKIINDLGKKMAGCDEILEGGINPSATITSWRGREETVKAIRARHDVIVGLSEKLYFNQFESLSFDEPMSSSWQPPISLRNVYEYDPLPEGLSETQKNHVLGAQGHVWGNFIKLPEQVEYAAVPRMTALAEVLWSPNDHLSWPGFLTRLSAFYKRLDVLGVNASRSVYKVSAEHRIRDGALEVELHTEGQGHVIRYTLDGSRPTVHSRLYSGPLMLTEKTMVRAAGQDSRTGALFGDLRMTLIPHKALGKPVSFGHQPKAHYAPGPAVSLLDGLVAYDRIFHPGEWAEFHDGNLDAIIDFEQSTEIQSVSLAFQPGKYRRLYYPEQVKLLVSNDRQTWQAVASVTEAQIKQHRPALRLAFPALETRYLRVLGINNRKVFSTRLEKKIPVSIFVDEIVVH